jgi:hypothetical protein
VRIKCIDEEEVVDNAQDEKDELIEKAQYIAKKCDASLNIIDE